MSVAQAWPVAEHPPQLRPRVLLSPHLDPKRLATSKARCALWGGVLTDGEGDDGRPLLIISRWALTRQFNDLSAVEVFLDHVGAPA